MWSTWPDLVYLYPDSHGDSGDDVQRGYGASSSSPARRSALGDFVPLPKALPQFGRGDQPTWTFPLLKLVGSEALRRYEMVFHHKDQPMAHFCFISLHKVVHVIASADVQAAWSLRVDSGYEASR